jgi:hypothetical protein
LKKNQYIAQYHKEIWNRANKETDSYFRSDWTAWIGNVISAIATGFLTAYLSKIISGENMPIWETSLIVFFATIFGLAFFIVAMFGWKGLWEVPAKMFREKEEELKLHTWDTAPISLQPFDIVSGEKGWAIRIDNKKNFPISAISQPVEVSKNGKTVFSIDGHWALFGFVNRKEGLIRQKVVHLREMQNFKTRERYSSVIEPDGFIEFVLTKNLDDNNYTFETDQDEIPTNPENSVMKLKIAGYVMCEDRDCHLPTITMTIYFDENGIPKIESLAQDEN